MSTPTETRTGSPASVITVGAGLVGLLVSLNSGAFPVALFLCAVSLAALPLALSDRPGARLVRVVVLGGLMAALGLCLALGPLLFGDTQRADRARNPARSNADVPSTPRQAPAPSDAGTPTVPGQ
ncbi:MAG: hypothetical protein JWN17_1609 [Frankiales bacterium]|nr:hypothetical protein [Frankiales bacterium]